MHTYIGGPVQINMMFLLLKKETQIGSKSVYLDAMEARVFFQPDTIIQFGDVIMQYKAWNRYVTEKHQVEFVELELPQTQA